MGIINFIVGRFWISTLIISAQSASFGFLIAQVHQGSKSVETFQRVQSSTILSYAREIISAEIVLGIHDSLFNYFSFKSLLFNLHT